MMNLLDGGGGERGEGSPLLPVHILFVQIQENMATCFISPLQLHFIVPLLDRFDNLRSGGSRISQTGGGGTNFQCGDANLLFNQMFPKNCMKMREFGPGRRPLRLTRSLV